MNINCGGAGASVHNLNSLIEWGNVSELERVLFGGASDDPELAYRAFGKEVRIFYLLLAEKEIDQISDGLIDLALSEKLTALVSLLPFEAAAVGGFLEFSEEVAPTLPPETKKFLAGKRRSFENAVSELTELDEDQLISLLLYLESRNIVSLKALNSILINAIFASGIFDFPDFFRLIAAGVPIGFAELVSEKEIEDSVLYSAP